MCSLLPCSEWKNGQLKGKKKRKKKKKSQSVPKAFQAHWVNENNIRAKIKRSNTHFSQDFYGLQQNFWLLSTCCHFTLVNSNSTHREEQNPHFQNKSTLYVVVGGMHFLQSPALEINEFLKSGDKLLTSTGFLTGIWNL